MGDRRSERLEIRTFKSGAEVRELTGFKESNPLTKTNYKELVGDYEFPEVARCCFQPDGRNLCRKWHKIGYVVRLLDNSLTIIGNVCAADNFDAEEQITKDRAKYVNEKRRSESMARVEELVANKQANMERLRTKREALKLMQERVTTFLTGIGTRCAARLEAMARDGRRDVVITGVRIRPYEELGEKRLERTKIPLTVGSLKGLAILRAGAWQVIFDRMHAVARAYDAAENLDEPIKTKAVDELRAILSDVDGIVANADELMAIGEAFLGNDFSPLPFLIFDTGDRTKLARFILKEGGKQKAKDWLQATEATLKQAHSVDKLEW